MSTTSSASQRNDAASNRDRLLEAAATVFADAGLQAPVEDVARVAGLGVGTLYRHFPTKDALIAELVRGLLGDVAAKAREALERSSDGDGLETFLYDLGALQSSQRGCLPRSWISSEHTKLVAEIRVLMTDLLLDAQIHGRVRDDLTPTDITVITWSMHGVIEASRSVAPDAWRRHLETHLVGLRPARETLSNAALSERQLDRIQEKRTHITR